MRIHPLFAIQCVAGLGLAAGVVWPWLDHQTAPGGPAVAAVAEAVVVDPPWWAEPLPPLSALPETTRRPLFEPSRRPPARGPGVPLAAVDPALALGRYRIDGVVVSDADRIAMVTDVTQGTLLTLREGHRLEGWQVLSVRLDGVTLEQGGDRLSIPVGTRDE